MNKTRCSQGIAVGVLWVLLVSTNVMLASCDSNTASTPGATSSGSGVSTVAASGTVNTGEIGGTGLTVLSYHSGESPVSQKGNFTATVSGDEPQILFVSDGKDELRALTLSNGVGALQVDATSTALGLLFLTPGIITLDQVEAQARIAQLTAFPSFANLVTYLKENLPIQSLDSLKAGAELSNYLLACVKEWQATLSPIQSTPVASTLTLQPLPNGTRPLADITVPNTTASKESAGFVEVSIPAVSAATLAAGIPVNIYNNAWRYVKIYKVSRAGENVFNGTSLVPPGSSISSPDNFLKPATAVKIGSIFTGTVGSPGFVTDILSISGNTKTVEYWIVGPGGRPGLTDLPSVAGHGDHWSTDDFNAMDFALAGWSTFDFVIQPILRIVGLPDTKVRNMATKMGSVISAGKCGGELLKLFTSNDPFTTQLQRTIDASVCIFKIFGEDASIGPQPILNLVKRITQGLEISNAVLAVATWAAAPHVSIIKVQKQPADNSWNGTWIGAGTGGCDQPIPIAIAYRVSGASGESGSLSFTIIPPSDPVHNVVGATFSMIYEGNIARLANPSNPQTNTLNGDTMTESYPPSCWTATLTRQ